MALTGHKWIKNGCLRRALYKGRDNDGGVHSLKKLKMKLNRMIGKWVRIC